MLGQDKSAKARQDFSLYGELMRSAGLPLTVGYTGHRWDPAIGQYFAPFRYYNPQTARWNMRDPLGMVDGPNIYAYVAGNPANNIDPDGLFIDTLFDLAMLGYDLYCGNYADAAWDGLALLIPGVPAGLSKVNRIGEVWNLHHKIPRFLGGLDTLDNLKSLPQSLHRKYHKESGHFSSKVRNYLKDQLKDDLEKLKKYKEWEPKDALRKGSQKIAPRLPGKKSGCI